MQLLHLESHHIVDLYCFVDDLLPVPPRKAGRLPTLRNSELITLLLWNAVVVHQKTLKDIHTFARLHLNDCFPHLPKYSAFVDHCHRVTPLMLHILETLMQGSAPIKIADATMLPVCKPKRADTHKVAASLAAFGKNWQGWHYGFKLHASIDLKGALCSIHITPANIHDAQVMPKILNKHTKIAVGDTLYGASVMRKHLWKTQGTIVIAPPHPTQKKKIATLWQHQLLNIRSKIESVYDIMKEHLHLVTSFPRSLQGYLVHYTRILLGYQILALGSRE